MAVRSGRRQQPAKGSGAASDKTTPDFVGRADVLAAVVGALEDGPALVVVEGEAGIGKTRLLREALGSPALAESVVLSAACPPVAEPFPLGAVVDGLRRLRDDVRDVQLTALGGALRPLFPEWAEHLPPALEGLDDPKETRHRLFRALTELVGCLGVEVIVVDDVHWADTATLEWLLTLITAEPVPVSIVVSYRPMEVPEGSLLLRLTSRAPDRLSRVRVELEPLDVTGTGQLVASMFSADEVSEQFAEFLHDRTDGLPLAVEECVRLLWDRHDIIQRHGQWSRRHLDEVEVPPTVRDSVLERVERLDPDVRAVLEAAAVLAAPADEQLLTKVAGLEAEAGPAAVAGALSSGLLQEHGPGRFAFRHVLDSQAVAEAIPASRWRHLHARAAEALQNMQPEPVVRLSRHFKEAGNTEAWCHHAEAAADLALESGDDYTTVATLLDVLNTTEHPIERRVRLAQKLADAAFFGTATLGEDTHKVAEALRAVLDTDSLSQGDRGELRLHLGRMLWENGEGGAAFEEMEAAIPDLGHRTDLALMAMTNLSLPVISEWPASRHMSWLDRASELVERSGSSSDRRVFDAARANTLLHLGEEAGWTLASRLPRSAAGPMEQRLVARTLLNVAETSITWGRYNGTQRLIDAAVECVESFDYQRGLDRGRLVKAYLDWYTGHWQDLSGAAVAIAQASESEPLEQLNARQLVGLLDLASGDRTNAERGLREVAGEYAPENLAVSAALARLYLADGSAEKALRCTGPAVELIARKGVWLWTGDIGPVHMDALVTADESGQAAEFAHDFAIGLDGRDAPAPLAALATCRAILTEAKGDLSQATELFADAAALWAGLPRPYDELLARERQGRCLLAAGERERALSVLSDARLRLDQLGARWDADRVAQLLRLHGVDVTRAWRRGPRGYGDELSPREKEVLALVARGMTNREAGEVLFLSPRTVGRHLSAAMRKLGVTTRTAAAIAATETGLIRDDSGIS